MENNNEFRRGVLPGNLLDETGYAGEKQLVEDAQTLDDKGILGRTAMGFRTSGIGTGTQSAIHAAKIWWADLPADPQFQRGLYERINTDFPDVTDTEREQFMSAKNIQEYTYLADVAQKRRTEQRLASQSGVSATAKFIGDVLPDVASGLGVTGVASKVGSMGLRATLAVAGNAAAGGAYEYMRQRMALENTSDDEVAFASVLSGTVGGLFDSGISYRKGLATARDAARKAIKVVKRGDKPTAEVVEDLTASQGLIAGGFDQTAKATHTADGYQVQTTGTLGTKVDATATVNGTAAPGFSADSLGSLLSSKTLKDFAEDITDTAPQKVEAMDALLSASRQVTEETAGPMQKAFLDFQKKTADAQQQAWNKEEAYWAQHKANGEQWRANRKVQLEAERVQAEAAAAAAQDAAEQAAKAAEVERINAAIKDLEATPVKTPEQLAWEAELSRQIDPRVLSAEEGAAPSMTQGRLELSWGGDRKRLRFESPVDRAMATFGARVRDPNVLLDSLQTLQRAFPGEEIETLQRMADDFVDNSLMPHIRTTKGEAPYLGRWWDKLDPAFYRAGTEDIGSALEAVKQGLKDMGTQTFVERFTPHVDDPEGTLLKEAVDEANNTITFSSLSKNNKTLSATLKAQIEDYTQRLGQKPGLSDIREWAAKELYGRKLFDKQVARREAQTQLVDFLTKVSQRRALYQEAGQRVPGNLTATPQAGWGSKVNAKAGPGFSYSDVAPKTTKSADTAKAEQTPAAHPLADHPFTKEELNAYTGNMPGKGNGEHAVLLTAQQVLKATDEAIKGRPVSVLESFHYDFEMNAKIASGELYISGEKLNRKAAEVMQAAADRLAPFIPPKPVEKQLTPKEMEAALLEVFGKKTVPTYSDAHLKTLEAGLREGSVKPDSEYVGDFWDNGISTGTVDWATEEAKQNRPIPASERKMITAQTKRARGGQLASALLQRAGYKNVKDLLHVGPGGTFLDSLYGYYEEASRHAKRGKTEDAILLRRTLEERYFELFDAAKTRKISELRNTYMEAEANRIKELTSYTDEQLTDDLRKVDSLTEEQAIDGVAANEYGYVSTERDGYGTSDKWHFYSDNPKGEWGTKGADWKIEGQLRGVSHSLGPFKNFEDAKSALKTYITDSYAAMKAELSKGASPEAVLIAEADAAAASLFKKVKSRNKQAGFITPKMVFILAGGGLLSMAMVNDAEAGTGAVSSNGALSAILAGASVLLGGKGLKKVLGSRKLLTDKVAKNLAKAKDLKTQGVSDEVILSTTDFQFVKGTKGAPGAWHYKVDLAHFPELAAQAGLKSEHLDEVVQSAKLTDKEGNRIQVLTHFDGEKNIRSVEDLAKNAYVKAEITFHGKTVKAWIPEPTRADWSVIQNDPSAALRGLGRLIASSPIGYLAEKGATPKATDMAADHLYKSIKVEALGRMDLSFRKHMNAWYQEKGLKPTLNPFKRMADQDAFGVDVARAKEFPNDPKVSEAARAVAQDMAAIEKEMIGRAKQLVEEMQAKGVEFLPTNPLYKFSQLNPDPTYVSRVVSKTKLDDLEAKVGHAGVIKVIRKSFESANAKVPKEKLDEIAQSIYETFVRIHDDAGVFISKDQSADLAVKLKDQGLDDETISAVLHTMGIREVGRGPGIVKARRMAVDLQASVTFKVDGKDLTVRMEDLYERNAMKLFGRWVNFAAGLEAMGTAGAAHGLNLTDDQVWKGLISQAKAQGASEKAIKTLEAYRNLMLGYQRDVEYFGVASGFERTVRTLTTYWLGSNFVLAQAADYGYLGAGATKRLMTMLFKGDVLKEIKGMSREELGSLASWCDSGLENVSASVANMDTASDIGATLAERLNHTTMKLNGMMVTSDHMALLKAMEIQEFLAKYANGIPVDEALWKHYATFGLDKSVADELVPLLRKHMVAEEGTDIFKGFNKQAMMQENLLLTRRLEMLFKKAGNTANSQASGYGETAKFFRANMAGRFLGQLNATSLFATQRTLGDIHNFDRYVMVNWAHSMALAAVSHIAKAYLMYGGDPKELDKRLTWEQIFLGSLRNSAFAGIGPNVIDALVHYSGIKQGGIFSGATNSGRDGGGELAVQAAIKTPIRAIAGITGLMKLDPYDVYTQAEARAMQRTLAPIWWIAPMTNFMAQDLPTKNPRRPVEE